MKWIKLPEYPEIGKVVWVCMELFDEGFKYDYYIHRAKWDGYSWLWENTNDDEFYHYGMDQEDHITHWTIIEPPNDVE